MDMLRRIKKNALLTWGDLREGPPIEVVQDERPPTSFVLGAMAPVYAMRYLIARLRRH